MANTTSSGIKHLHDKVTGVSVILPCKDEEEAVGSTVERVAKTLGALEDIDFEILVVDDCSVDNTRREALKAGANVLVNDINMGYGNSIMNGMQAAKYSLIAIMDSDNTYPIESLPELIEKARHHDMVIGTRTWTGDNTSLIRSALRRCLYYTILYLTNVRAPDFNSGFRVFHKYNILEFRQILCPTFSFTTSLTLFFLLSSKSVFFMPIAYSPRTGDSKVSYLSNSLVTFLYIFILANIFQAYRLSIMFIMACIAMNVGVMLVCGLFSIGAATQAGMHITVSAVAIIAVMAMIITPVTKMYLDKLQKK